MNSPLRRLLLALYALSALAVSTAAAQEKAKLSFDDAFNSVDFSSVRLSPDGQSVVFVTTRADWDQNIFRKDIWLYRDANSGQPGLVQLTQSGHDIDPQWSPDGRWIAFLSERNPAAVKQPDPAAKKDNETAQLYLISPSGGEALPLTRGEEEVHAFAWSADSRGLYFATRTPWTRQQKEAYKKDWQDVLQYRAGERGDQIFALPLMAAFARRPLGTTGDEKDEKEGHDDATPGAHLLANTPWHVQQLVTSHDGLRLAFVTESVSERQEKIDEFEIYSVDLRNAATPQTPRQLTHNNAVEGSLQWSPDNRHIFFSTQIGSVEGPYRDTQERLYWVDSDNGNVQRWAAKFDGSVTHYAAASDGSALITGRLGTEVQLYSQSSPDASLTKLTGWAGTYEQIATAQQSPRVAFIHSTLDKPTEVYLADSFAKASDAKPITTFNRLFADRDLPKGKPYRWKSFDGTTVEGMLMYPPGKFEATHLPMFVLIHGGPADADGNHFETDWYQYQHLAATNGWLVFEPNYRGSTGYGDKFLDQIIPQMVSVPGKDILAGVDALVKDGIADTDHLTIGGYSYGGYMTNWLITQTTRFKAAVTGAGAVEHVANWGNDDTTFDDAFFLGGLPWEAPQRYHDEAAIFQINKVRTPTHIVAGSADIRVAVAEDYLLDHALHNLGVPSTLLIFPDEGHSLTLNPWHGKIKAREELKWLEKYGR